MKIFSSPWNYVEGNGYQNYNYPTWLFLTIPYYLSSFMSISVKVTEYTLFVGVLTFSGFSMFRLLKYLLKDSLNGKTSYALLILISLFYANNYYVFLYPFDDNLFLWLVYSISPLYILLVLRSYEEISNRNSILFVSILILISFPLVIFLIDYPAIPILLFIITMAIFFSHKFTGNLNKISLKILYVTFLIIILSLINSWSFPFLFHDYSSNSAAFSGVSSFATQVLALHNNSKYFPGFFSYLFPTITPGLPSIGLSYYSLGLILCLPLPFLSYLPLFTKFGRGRLVYLVSAILLIIFQTFLGGYKGLASVFYDYLYFPGSPLIAFQNLGLVFGYGVLLLASICLAYSVILFSSLNKPNERVRVNNSRINENLHLKRKTKKIVITVLIVTILLSQFQAWEPNSVPSNIGISSMTTFPSYYSNLAKYLDNHSENHLILGLPVGAGWIGMSWGNESGGIIGNFPLKWWSGIPSIADAQIPPNDTYFLYNVIYPLVTSSNTKNLTNILSDYNIKYVLLQTNFLTGWSGGPPPFNISHLEAFLAMQNNLTLVEKFGPEWLYLNDNPENFISTSVPTFFSPTPSNPVNKFTLNKTFYYSFSRTNDIVVLNGSKTYESFLKPNNTSLSLYQHYYNVTGTSNVGAFYSNLALNLNTKTYDIVVVNFTSNANTNLLIIGRNSTSSYSDGGYYHVLGFSKSTGDIPIDNGTRTIIYQAPSDFVLNYLELLIAVTDPANNTNYSLVINSMYLAQYASYAQWPSFLLNNHKVSTFSNINISSNNIRIPSYFSWKELTPSKIEITFNSSGAIFLYFAQTYSRSWYLISQSGAPIQYKHITVNNFANGWVIYGTGNRTIFIIFKPHFLNYENVLWDSSIIMGLVLCFVFVFLYFRNIGFFKLKR